MTRNEVSLLLNNSTSNNNVLELSTGFGKTFLALNYINSKSPESILIVVPRLVLIENWKEEIIKWKYEHLLDKITFVTYASLHKHEYKYYDVICYDESHHLSDRCKGIVITIQSTYNLFLSATLKKDLKWWLRDTYKGINFISVSLKESIDSEILPDPRVILLPLQLDNRVFNQILVKESKSKTNWIDCLYSQRWKYLKSYNCRIKCTEYQYYDEISKDVEYWKKQSMFKSFFTNKWLRLCGERLKWLSDIKTNTVKELLKLLKDYRTLTFCNSIAQTEELGKYCINSKNKKANEYLEMFNAKKIKHITSCEMLSEGINLADCRVGIFAVLNSSEILIKQKNGRLLRNANPVIIIPYYKHTREEELVQKMLENYNPELVEVINNIKDIKI